MNRQRLHQKNIYRLRVRETERHTDGHRYNLQSKKHTHTHTHTHIHSHTHTHIHRDVDVPLSQTLVRICHTWASWALMASCLMPLRVVMEARETLCCIHRYTHGSRKRHEHGCAGKLLKRDESKVSICGRPTTTCGWAWQRLWKSAIRLSRKQVQIHDMHRLPINPRQEQNRGKRGHVEKEQW